MISNDQLEYSNTKTSRHHYPVHQVLKSINLSETPYSGTKYSNSRPLTYTEQSESMNNLNRTNTSLTPLVSLSSEHSLGRRSRSGSISNPNAYQQYQQTNHDLSTTNNTYIANQRSASQIQETSTFHQLKERSEKKFASIHETFQEDSKYSTFKRISDKKPSQLLSPVQEIFQSKVSEFQYLEGRSNMKVRSANASKSPQQVLSVVNKSSRTLQQLQNVFHHSHDKENNTDVSNKMAILIKENEKLIHINEELMNELETVRKNGQKLSATNLIDFGSAHNRSVMDDSKLVQQLKREINQLQINQKKYISMNDNYKQQIANLTGIISEQNQTQRSDEQVAQLKRQIQQLNESLSKERDQKIKLGSSVVLCKLELERQLEERNQLQGNVELLGNQKMQWQSKLNIILDENERLNAILSERLQQADTFNQTVYDLQNQINHEKRSHQESMLEQQIRSNEISQKQDSLLAQKNREILALQQLLEENQNLHKEHYNMNILKDKVRELENLIIEKNEAIGELNNKLRSADSNWREKCKTYQTQLKDMYKKKYKHELQKIDGASKSYFNVIIQQQQVSIESLQQQLQLFAAENEQLKVLLNEQQILQLQNYNQEKEHVRRYRDIWERERVAFEQEISRLKSEIRNYSQKKSNEQRIVVQRIEHQKINQQQDAPSHIPVTNQEHQFSNRNHRAQSFTSGVKIRKERIHTQEVQYQQMNESYGLQSKYNMLEENKKMNRMILERCTELMNRQF